MSHKDLYCRKCNIQFENREELDKHLFSGLDSRHLPKPPAPPNCACCNVPIQACSNLAPPKAEVREWWIDQDGKAWPRPCWFSRDKTDIAVIEKSAYLALETELALARSQVKYSVGIHDEFARLTSELEQVKAENAAWPERFLAESDALRDLCTDANERAKGLADVLEKYKNQSASVQTIDMAAREALDTYKGEDK